MTVLYGIDKRPVLNDESNFDIKVSTYQQFYIFKFSIFSYSYRKRTAQKLNGQS